MNNKIKKIFLYSCFSNLGFISIIPFNGCVKNDCTVFTGSSYVFDPKTGKRYYIHNDDFIETNICGETRQYLYW